MLFQIIIYLFIYSEQHTPYRATHVKGFFFGWENLLVLYDSILCPLSLITQL